MNKKYFIYDGETFWFDTNIKYRIDETMKAYEQALQALISLKNLGIILPNDSRCQLRMKLADYAYHIEEEHQIKQYINYRMSEIEYRLGIHNNKSRF